MKYSSFFLFSFMSMLLISYIGFTQDGIDDIQDISMDELLNINISTAAKYNQKISEAPASVAIITSEDIERYGYRSLDEVFANVRGFYVSNDRNYGYLGARGFSRPTDYNNRLLTLVNGHKMNDRLYGSSSIDTVFAIDLDNIERIEVVRGPGSALYGTNAMFAVINIITKKADKIDGIKASATAGSYGRLNGKISLGKEFDNDLGVFLSGSLTDIKGQEQMYYEEYDDPETNNGISEDEDWEKHYRVLACAEYGAFSLQGIVNYREKGIPTAPWEIIFNSGKAKTIDEHNIFELKYDNDIGADKNIILRSYIDRYFYKGLYPYEDSVYSDKSEDLWFGGELQFRWDLYSNNRLIAGAEYQNHFRASYLYLAADYTIFEGNFPHNILSFYLQDEYQILKSLALTIGIRTDIYQDTGSSTNPRVAVVYNPVKSGSLKLLYGQAFRVPSIYEAYYEEESFQALNPDLDPEQIRTSEIVWEQFFGRGIFGAVSIYSYRMKNLIDNVDISDEQEVPLTQFQNINNVKANGIELELNARLKNGFRGYVNYALQRAKDADLDDKLTNSPSHIAKLGLVYPILDYIYIAGEFQYETERITVYETKTEPYFLANINLSTKWLFNHLRCSFLIRNAFDVDYSFPGGFEHRQAAILQDGRNFSFKVDFRF